MAIETLYKSIVVCCYSRCRLCRWHPKGKSHRNGNYTINVVNIQ